MIVLTRGASLGRFGSKWVFGARLGHVASLVRAAGQQAAIVASAQDWAKAQTHGGYRKADQGATLHLETAKSRASESGANLRTQVSGLAEPMMIQAATAASCSIGSMASLSPIAPSSLRNVRNSGLPDDESIR